MSNLSELLDLHNDLDEMFFAHQAALLHFNFDEAVTLLERYEDALTTHMQDEEDVLFPIYAERGEIPSGGKLQFFLDEHYKMREFVKLLKEEIVKLKDEAQPEAQLLFILDRESFYKRLCGHHDKRETDIMYPELDRITTDAEKTELLSRVTRSFSKSSAA